MLQTLLSGRGRRITHIAGWTLVSLITFYLLAGLLPFGEAAARTALFIGFPMALFYINARILTNRYFETGRYTEWIVYAVLLWLGLTTLRIWTEFLIFGDTIFSRGTAVGARSNLNVYLVTLLIYFVLMIFSGLYQLLENRRELEAQHAAAQLNYLKAQINPHFLFNTLNNIYAAATLQHPKTAQMVLRLSDLLRYVTYEGALQRTSLDKEIAQIHAYIELFQLKSEHPLPIPFEQEGDTTPWMIEPLLLLPLVENALKHGDLEENPNAFLRIRLRVQGKQLEFEVENSYNPDNQQKDAQGGVGLENIRQRLELQYGGWYQLLTTTPGPNHFKVNLRITQP